MLIDPEKRAEIGQSLDDVERRERVTILFAVESGSRAWQFASPDSDYDVRFVYLRPRDWYLSIEPGRDVIERPIAGDLDVAGWDLPKALRLLVKSNPVLLEWLVSPIRYRELPGFVGRLHGLANLALSFNALSRHYRSLAQRQFDRAIDGRDRIRLKRYFYVLRPVLALRWLRRHRTQPPMAMPDLIAGAGLPPAVLGEITELTRRKAETRELGEAERNSVLDAFVLEELTIADLSAPDRPDRAALVERANAFFRDCLEDCGDANRP